MPSATSSGADASSSSANGSARSREHKQGNQERKYTVEQKAAVLRIRRCKPTAFYDILGLEEVRTTCTEADIKRAYRKLSLLTHPDKNGHEHADEAFKMVSRAFSVLGDKEKREKYDRYGTDPDSRFGGGGPPQNPFSGFAGRGAGAGGGGGMGGGGGGMWEDEISPEEMFARFFGGGGFGGPFGGFDTGPQFVFNFGGPGIRVHQFGGPRPRRRPRDQERGQEGGIANIIMGLLPILLLFIFPLLSSLFSGSTSQPAAPTMVFDSPLPPLYTQERTMPNLKTKYYVNPKDVEQYSNYKLNQLDKTAEVTLVRRLKTECENEMLHKQRLREAAQGWFFQDPEKMELAEKMEMPNCKRLKKMGIS